MNDVGRRSGVFNIKFEHILHFFSSFFIVNLTWNKEMLVE